MSFFVIATTVLVVLYGYVGVRLIVPAKLSPGVSAILWTALAVSALIVPVMSLARRGRVETWWSEALSWLGYLSMGAILLAFVFVFVRDIYLVLGIGIPKITGLVQRLAGTEPSLQPMDVDRRRFLTLASNAGIVALSAGLTGFGLWSARRKPPVVRTEVALRNLPPEFDGFRIAHVSDIHVGPTIKRGFVEEVVEAIESIGADMIAITGDLVDGSVRRLDHDTAPLAGLYAPYGKYFVTGNHEYYSGADQWVSHLQNGLGFDALMNEHRILERDGGRLVIAGVTDYSQRRREGTHRSDPEKALNGSPEGVPRILLAHQPASVFDASDAGVDLQLSGHTHGGQFFPWNIVVHLFQPFVSGLGKHNGTHVFVTRGAGYWGPPLRVGAPPEVAEITLRRVA